MNTNGTHYKGMQIAVCQIKSTNNPEHNLQCSESVIRDAVKAGAQACFLPECADFVANGSDEFHALSKPLSKHTYVLGLQKLAKELSVYISAGVHERPEEDEPEAKEDDERAFNTHLIIGPDGEFIAKYRKVHLHDVKMAEKPNGKRQKMEESGNIRPGKVMIDPVEIGDMGKVGLALCYDLRFTEMHLTQRRLGADVLTFPSAWVEKTGHHWDPLNRAASIQNQAYVIACGQYGKHNDSRTSWGESLAYDPWGLPLGKLRCIKDDEEEAKIYETSGEFFLCEISAGRARDIREQVPLEEQNRDEIYGSVGDDAKTI